MALLGAGGVALLEDDARPPDADNPFGYHEYAPVRRLATDSQWVAHAEGHAVKVIHLLLPALPRGPEYRVILVCRDLREVVASQDRMLARRGENPGAVRGERLVAVLSAQLDQTRAWLREQPRISWMELDYDALLCEPEVGLAKLIDFAGLRATPRLLAALVRPDRVRERGEDEAGPAAGAASPQGRR